MTTRPSGYAPGEPSACSPAQFRAWVADHAARGIARTELAACLGVPWKTLQNWSRGYAKVPAWVVRRLVAEGVRLPCVNPACGQRRDHGRRCFGCAAYWYRHHTERPDRLCHRQPTPAACANPVCPMPRERRARRCNACRVYRWRYGTERPASLAQPRRTAVA